MRDDRASGWLSRCTHFSAITSKARRRRSRCLRRRVVPRFCEARYITIEFFTSGDPDVPSGPHRFIICQREFVSDVSTGARNSHLLLSRSNRLWEKKRTCVGNVSEVMIGVIGAFVGHRRTSVSVDPLGERRKGNRLGTSAEAKRYGKE